MQLGERRTKSASACVERGNDGRSRAATSHFASRRRASRPLQEGGQSAGGEPASEAAVVGEDGRPAPAWAPSTRSPPRFGGHRPGSCSASAAGPAVLSEPRRRGAQPRDAARTLRAARHRRAGLERLSGRRLDRRPQVGALLRSVRNWRTWPADAALSDSPKCRHDRLGRLFLGRGRSRSTCRRCRDKRSSDAIASNTLAGSSGRASNRASSDASSVLGLHRGGDRGGGVQSLAGRDEGLRASARAIQRSSARCARRGRRGDAANCARRPSNAAA